MQNLTHSAAQRDAAGPDPQANEGASAAPPMVMLLDPALVTQSDPNRLPEAYETEAFEALVDSIFKCRGNTVPIVVRLLTEQERSPGSEVKYQLISGARRLKACAAAQVPVRAVVQTAATTTHVAIDRLVENHLRQSLSPYELGVQLLHIQQLHEPPSKRALARLIGMDESQVHKAIDIAQLPAVVLSAFSSPAEIRYADAKPLRDACNTALEAVLKEAEATGQEGRLKPSAVVKRLTQAAAAARAGEGVEPFNTPSDAVADLPLEVNGQQFGQLGLDKRGNAVVTIALALTPAQREAFARHIECFVRRRLMRSSSPKGSHDDARSGARSAASQHRKPDPANAAVAAPDAVPGEAS